MDWGKRAEKKVRRVVRDRPHVAVSLRDADAGVGETGPRGVGTRFLPACLSRNAREMNRCVFY